MEMTRDEIEYHTQPTGSGADDISRSLA
jgi:hypothetical protein